MNEEEKKVINIFIEKCNKYDESVEIKGISVGEEYRMLDTVCKALNLIEKLQKENEELKNKLLDTLEGQKVIKEETPQYIKENYISKEKVKDKIETLEKIQKEFPNNERLEVKIIAYKELLEKEQ